MTIYEDRYAGRWVLLSLGVAIAYAVTGKLSLMLAIPPGFATAIWPPAGIALAVTLIWGSKVLPGVFVGSILTNIWTFLDPSSDQTVAELIIVPTIIGIGSAVQAMVGAYLIRKFANFPNRLDKERDIFLFMLFGGPIGCLINATVGVGSLMLTGIIPSTNTLTNFMTWWAGDVTGVLIFTPLVLLYTMKPRESWKPRQLTVTLSMTGAFILTVFFVNSGLQWERQRLKFQFDQQLLPLAPAIEQTLSKYINVLYSLEGFYAATPNMTRQQFSKFTQRQFTILPGIQALSWNPLIHQNERAQFESAIQQEGFAHFHITERNADGKLIPANDRDEYVSVQFIEPFDSNIKAFGFDVASNKIRKEALELARATGQPFATAPIKLIQETGSQFGILVFMPIYQTNGSDKTTQKTRTNLTGYMVGVFRGGDIIKSAIEHLDQEGISYRLSDKTEPYNVEVLIETTLHEMTVSVLDEEGIFGGYLPISRHTSVNFAGREWIYEVSPTQSYLTKHRQNDAWIILVGGMVLTSFVGAFFLITTGRREFLKDQVEEKTKNLRNQRKIAEQERDKAEQASKAKTNFINVVSHELRTPTQGLKGPLEEFSKQLALFKGMKKLNALKLAIPSEYREPLQQAINDLETEVVEIANGGLESANHLLTLINEILDFAKMDAGKLTINPTSTNVSDSINDVINIIGSKIKNKNLDLKLTVPNNVWVWADPIRLKQILINILGNAEKFCDEGRISVSVEQEGNLVHFIISDTGLGVPSDKLDIIFKAFEQIDDSMKREFGGTGLGLPLAADLVERQGGKIWVQSEQNVGSHFHFTLPVAGINGAGYG
ncbi:CHASE domain-containing protein, partial [Magnetovibrio blakemorei]